MFVPTFQWRIEIFCSDFLSLVAKAEQIQILCDCLAYLSIPYSQNWSGQSTLKEVYGWNENSLGPTAHFVRFRISYFKFKYSIWRRKNAKQSQYFRSLIDSRCWIILTFLMRIKWNMVYFNYLFRMQVYSNDIKVEARLE